MLRKAKVLNGFKMNAKDGEIGAVKESPHEYTHDSLVTRDYESELHRHYNYQGYWIDEEINLSPSLK